MSDPTTENSNSAATRHAVEAVKEMYEIKNLLDEPFIILESRLDEKREELEKSFNEKIESLEKSSNEKIGGLEENFNEKVESLKREFDILKWVIGIVVAIGGIIIGFFK